MTTITIQPGLLSGTVVPPSSKSISHRLILCAALARGTSTIRNLSFSQDVLATLHCAEGLGATWVRLDNSSVEITGIGGLPKPGALPILPCGESGSTLRFLIPIALAVAGGGVFTGSKRLMERPLKPYFDLFDQKGIAYEQKEGTLTIRGELTAGEYPIPGNVSSQFLTGLLMALPLVEGNSTVLLTTPLESRDYVSLTLEAQGDAGVAICKVGNRFRVPGGQSYETQDRAVEADWSQAAVWYQAIAYGNQVELEGMNAFSSQGDMAVVSKYLRLIKPGNVEIDVSQCPDLVPPLAAMAALRSGTTRVVNAGRLRIKESDRLATVTEVLNALGARVEEYPDSLTIHGRDRLEGGVSIDCHNDHRIAMMAAVAATRCEKPVTLVGAECVNKSYPSFWEHYRMLGGKLDVLVSG